MDDDVGRSVFISYRRRVASFIARAVYQDLTAHGFNVFMDVVDLDAGGFKQVIVRQIASRPHFIVILTPGTLERCEDPNDWLRQEIEYAIQMERNIVPVLANGFDFSANMRYLTGTLAELKERNALPVPHEYFDEAMERLRKRFLRQHAPGTLIPAPRKDLAEVARRLAIVDAQPEVTTQDLTAEDYFIRAIQKQDEFEDLDGAIADFGHAIKLNPEYVMAYNNRGNAYALKGNMEGAIADWNETLRLDPCCFPAYNNRGNGRKSQGDFTGAITDFDKALSLEPKSAHVYHNRASARHSLGDLDGAIADYTSALKLDANNARSFYNRGTARYANGDLVQAINDWDEAIRLDPTYAAPYYNRAVARRAQGNLLGALEDFQRFLTMGGGDHFQNRDKVTQQIHELEARLG
ncbi:MAG: tetratricopeptide repeat protein [Anaerolineae bacterium]|nr:tetratricopeptide repeat protein [Anaerolineae bacterium]